MSAILKINKAFKKVSQTLSFIGAIWIFVIMLIIIYDVIARAAFDSSFMGTSEIVRNSIVGIAFFMIPWAMVMESHVRTTIIVERAGPKLGKVLDIIAYILGIAVFAIIAISGIEPLSHAIANGEFELAGTFRLITWPVRAIIVLGSVLTCWHCLMILINRINPKFNIYDEEEADEEGGEK